MDRMLYLAMGAATQMLNAQAMASHNLANATTTGFKADFEAFRALPVFGDGYPSRVFAMAERPGIDFAPGTVETTGRELDVAIDDRGFFAIQAPDGSEAYSRSGEFAVNVNGQLVTPDGQAVLGNGGPIVLPQFDAVVIGDDGTISIRPVGQESTTLVQVDRLKLVNPELDLLEKGPDGLFRTRDGVPPPADAAVRVSSGALERSNVNPVSELIALIENARQYEMAVKAMDSVQKNDELSTKIMRVG